MVESYRIVFVALVVVILFLVYLLFKALRKLKVLEESTEGLKHDIRSMNVKHGQHWENFVPFMPDFEKIANKENTVFLGMPVDLISFDDDAVKFIEVKTGKSRLSEKQEKIKKLIDEKKVKWFELRYEK